MEVGDDHFDGDVRLVLPAIVVGDHRHRGVGDLGFARAFGFAEIGHADDVVAELVVGRGFGARAEGRAFHVHVGAAVVDARLERARVFRSNWRNSSQIGSAKAMCADDAASEKRVFEDPLGAVEELVDEHDVARFVFRLQRADGADADDPLRRRVFSSPRCWRDDSVRSAGCDGRVRGAAERPLRVRRVCR